MNQSPQTKQLGTFFELGSAEAMEAIGIAGYDFVIIDGEHGPFGPVEAMALIRAAELKGTEAFVRVAEISRSAVLKMLDVGAKGLIVPCVETVDQVKNLVKWAKYAPVGQRGFFMARPGDYGHHEQAATVAGYMDYMNRQVKLIPQCETQGALDTIETIMALEGVDGIFVGPFDLSIAMGMPGAFDHPDFQKALDRILKAAHQTGKPAYIFAPNEAKAKEYYAMGFDAVALSMDVGFLIDALKAAKAQVL